MKWLDRLDRKIGRFAIPHVMYLLSGIMLAVYLAGFLFPDWNLEALLYLDRELVAQGEAWRLITFIFLPPSTSPIWILFSLYFYCLIGNSLESQWGSFKFNVFYLVGILGTILAAFITGSATNAFLNLSLFLAFAALYPNFEVLIFFILPIKVKSLALLDIIFFIFQLISGTWAVRAAIIASLLNVLLFFGWDFFKNIKHQSGYWKTRRNFRKYNRR